MTTYLGSEGMWHFLYIINQKLDLFYNNIQCQPYGEENMDEITRGTLQKLHFIMPPLTP
jgi:hypothetical protein